MIGSEMRALSVDAYAVLEHLPGYLDGEEGVDVSGFSRVEWRVRFEVRPTVTFFGRRVWAGDWRKVEAFA